MDPSVITAPRHLHQKSIKMANMRSGSAKRASLALPLVMILFILVVAVLVEVAEGRRSPKQSKNPQRRTKKSRAGVGKDFSEFLMVISIVMTCVIAPVFLFFLHSLYKDPAVPELARAGYQAVKGKLLSYLGQEADPATRNGLTSSAPSGFEEMSRASSLSSTRRQAVIAAYSTRRAEATNALSDYRYYHDRREQQPFRYKEAGHGRTSRELDQGPQEQEDRFGQRRQSRRQVVRTASAATMAPHSSSLLLPLLQEDRHKEDRAIHDDLASKLSMTEMKNERRATNGTTLTELRDNHRRSSPRRKVSRAAPIRYRTSWKDRIIDGDISRRDRQPLPGTPALANKSHDSVPGRGWGDSSDDGESDVYHSENDSRGFVRKFTPLTASGTIGGGDYTGVHDVDHGSGVSEADAQLDGMLERSHTKDTRSRRRSTTSRRAR